MPNLVFIKEVEPKIYRGWKLKRGLYECACGNMLEATMAKVKSGHTQSCGCYNKQRIIETKKTHGKSDTHLYTIWASMKQRCYNKNNKFFDSYGARGIQICDTWKKDFESFFSWAINNGYQKSLKIDRINNDGNYEPSNCRWVTQEVQSQNTKSIYSNNSTGFRGVIRYGSKFLARIGVNKKRIFLGYFKTDIEAAQAYNGYIINNKLEHPLNRI